MVDKQKRVLLVIEGISLGGTSTSFLNLLSAMKTYSEADITVGLINIAQKDMLPSDVKVIDLSCMSRKVSGKFAKVTHICRAGVIAWLHLKLMQCDGNSSGDIKRISTVQKFEMGEARSIKKAIDLSEEYDVVISWCEMFTDYLLAYKIKAKRKLAWIHPHYEQAGFSKKTDSKMISRVDGVVAVSKAGCDSLKKVFSAHEDKFYCVNNKLIPKDIIDKSKQKKVEYSNEVCNMITVARIQNISKALDRMVNVLKKLHDEGFKFKWRIVGGGEDTEYICRMITDNRLEDSIELLGPQENPFPYVAASDMFLLCSRYEGFPMVVDEALILGVPVMITDYAASSEQIKDGVTGFIVSNSEEGIYGGIREVLEHPQKLIDIRNYLMTMDHAKYTDCDDIVSLIRQISEGS